MTDFTTQIGNGQYRLCFETDEKSKYLEMQRCARNCVDNRIERNSHESDFDRYLSEQLKDPEFKREWELRQSGWISVDDRLPEDEKDVLTSYKFKISGRRFCGILCYFCFDEKPHWQHEGLGDMIVTHWTPLPEPPKEDK